MLRSKSGWGSGQALVVLAMLRRLIHGVDARRAGDRNSVICIPISSLVDVKVIPRRE